MTDDATQPTREALADAWVQGLRAGVRSRLVQGESLPTNPYGPPSDDAYRSPVCADGGICYGCKDCQRPDTNAAQPNDTESLRGALLALGSRVAINPVTEAALRSLHAAVTDLAAARAEVAALRAAQPTQETLAEYINRRLREDVTTQKDGNA